MNFHNYLPFVCVLLAFISSTFNCHSLSKRKAEPLFHLLFPRKRPRGPKKLKLVKAPPQYYITYQDHGNHQSGGYSQGGYMNNHVSSYGPPPAPSPHPHPSHPPPPHPSSHPPTPHPPSHPPAPVPPPSSYEYPYNGPTHTPQVHNFNYEPPGWFDADEYGNPHGEGHFDFEAFGPFDEEDYKEQNHHYEEPPNEISHRPESPHPPPTPHSFNLPPPPTSDYSPPKQIHNHVHIHETKRPSGPSAPLTIVELKPVKFPKKFENIVVSEAPQKPTRQKDLNTITKETIYREEYPIKDTSNPIKDRGTPVLLPAGVKGLDASTIEFIKNKVREYTQNRPR